MNENLKGGTAKASARRRLVRGVFSAPAAMTLYSGSVAAASVTCVAKQLTTPITTPPATPDATLVRVPLYMLTVSGETGKYVRQTDIAGLIPPGGSYLTAGQVQLVSKTAGFSGTVGDITSSPAGLGPTSPLEYVAVRVNSTGKIEGVLSLTVPGTNTALHVSCWTSFGGVALFN